MITTSKWNSNYTHRIKENNPLDVLLEPSIPKSTRVYRKPARGTHIWVDKVSWNNVSYLLEPEE